MIELKLLPGHIMKYCSSFKEPYMITKMDVQDCMLYDKDPVNFMMSHMAIDITSINGDHSFFYKMGFKPCNGYEVGIWICEYELTSLYIDINTGYGGICHCGKIIWSKYFKYLHEVQTFVLGITGNMPTFDLQTLNQIENESN